ncbi:hypothetical protein PsorP6_017850 [Peronosclerospora sorghi]|uniref:Uncharacterized protein n=1 Tax=Peronosclerospora sorghi TaxID=230839 RepID=A0ACC0WCS4_9STRA|nr:hypothetical protein PsorP6_017850 [Peronosclerospora sorghi]
MIHGGNASCSNSTLHRYASDDLGSFGSMLDQLHAEQKGTIEALTCQVEFYRQREERARQELATLRRCLPLDKGDEGAATISKLASENRALGDELDSMRMKKNGWDRNRTRLEKQNKDLEKQLKDAKHTLASFSHAIEQLEIKMQRKEAEIQTRCLELENELGDTKQECEQLQKEKKLIQQQLENLQTISDENARLRGELQGLLTNEEQSVSDHASSSIFSSEIKKIKEKFSSLENDKRRHEKEITALQQNVAACTAEMSAARLEVEHKNNEIKELQLKLDNSTNMQTLREQLLADESSKKEFESQRQELLIVVSALQREKSDLQSKICSLQKEQETTKSELQTAKSRLAAKDQTVVVSTLRSEVFAVKQRLRSELMHEKECLKSEIETLNRDIVLLRGQLAEKDLAVHNMENVIFQKDENQKQKDYDIRQLREQINRLNCELDQSRVKYEQLQQCRTSLSEQLDFGFKELLHDEESAAVAREEIDKLRSELKEVKNESRALQSERQKLAEELERVSHSKKEASTRQNEKIDDLYCQLLEKEAMIASLKITERQVTLLKEEKEKFERDIADARLRCENQVEEEVQKTHSLRCRIEELEKDKLSLKIQIEALENESTSWKEKVQVAELSLRQKDKEIKNLECDISHLKLALLDAKKQTEKGQEEIANCEQKLMKERKTMEREMVQLVRRIENAGQRNFELGEKVIALAQQSKVDQADRVAFSSQVKCYKEKVKTLETQLGQLRRCNGRDSDAVSELQRKVSDLSYLKESYQVEIKNLQEKLGQVECDFNVVKQQRDEAVKRVRLLVQCRNDMKATAEDYTAELVEEIEALQHQMESERKRCAVLLSNEKMLLRDLHERNAAIQKLHCTLASLQALDRSGNNRSNSLYSSRMRSRDSNGTGIPVDSSNQSTSPTSSLSHHQLQQQEGMDQFHSASVSNMRPIMTTSPVTPTASTVEHYGARADCSSDDK